MRPKMKRALSVAEMPSDEEYGAIIVAVGHQQFKEIVTEDFEKLKGDDCFVFDIKSALRPGLADYTL